MEYTTIVAATASEVAPLQYIAPYIGVTIAEEWMEEGKDVLIVYDDLMRTIVFSLSHNLSIVCAVESASFQGRTACLVLFKLRLCLEQFLIVKRSDLGFQ